MEATFFAIFFVNDTFSRGADFLHLVRKQVLPPQIKRMMNFQSITNSFADRVV